MTEDQLEKYLAENPAIRRARLPSGWQPLETVPLAALNIELLRADGTTYSGGISNTVVLTDPVDTVGWRRL